MTGSNAPINPTCSVMSRRAPSPQTSSAEWKGRFPWALHSDSSSSDSVAAQPRTAP